jgi:hypothetical protein
MAVNFKINGSAASVDTPADTPLLWVIREQLKLTGTKFGCGAARAGALPSYIRFKRRPAAKRGPRRLPEYTNSIGQTNYVDDERPYRASKIVRHIAGRHME